MPDLKVVQSFTFNEDGTGSIEQTGDLTNSLTMSWAASGSTLTMNVDNIGGDTVYLSFEDNGSTMIFSESEVTQDVTTTLNREKTKTAHNKKHRAEGAIIFNIQFVSFIGRYFELPTVTCT